VITEILKTAEVKSLYEKHGSALVAYVCCCGVDFASAEDVVQQLFLKLLQGHTPKPQTPLAYLYRAVLNHRNLVLNGFTSNHLSYQLYCPFHPSSLRHPTTLHALGG
jgi:hypothetical protein